MSKPNTPDDLESRLRALHDDSTFTADCACCGYEVGWVDSCPVLQAIRDADEIGYARSRRTVDDDKAGRPAEVKP